MSNKYSKLDSVFSDRSVIPLWKSPKSAIESSAENPIKIAKRHTASAGWIQHLKSTYSQFPSNSSANELFEITSMYQIESSLPITLETATKRIQTKINKIELFESIPHNTKLDGHEEVARKNINYLKKQLYESPNRPFCWSELSRNYLIVAEPEKAAKSMQVALGLAQHNRYLQRAATRLYVNIGEADRALKLLRHEPSLASDPWLLAAEIATTTNLKRPSKLYSSAKNLLSSCRFSKFQMSELSAAMATVELSHGANKKAKLLFNDSLVSPTQNSLAQAQWAVSQDSNIIIPANAWTRTTSYEAEAWAKRDAGEWDKAIQACILWLADEPYSITAALMGSYFGFWRSHNSTAEQFATVGLRSFNTNTENTNISLLNNRAVARAFQNKISEAYEDFMCAMELSDGKHNAHLIATLGLIAFKAGFPEYGKNFYSKSIAWFSQEKDLESATRAILYLMREEIKWDFKTIPKAVGFAKKIIDLPIALKLPEIRTMSETLIEEAESLVKSQIQTNNAPQTNLTAEILELQSLRFEVPKSALNLLTKNQDYLQLVKF